MFPARHSEKLRNGLRTGKACLRQQKNFRQSHACPRIVPRSSIVRNVLKHGRRSDSSELLRKPSLFAPPRLPSLNDAVSSVLSSDKLASNVLTAAAAAGITLGLFGPSDPFLPAPVSQLSSCMGWLYFLSWSISFYPQLLENWKRKSVEGFSADYIIYHAAGYVAYFLYTYCLLFNSDIRGAFALENSGSLPDIQVSDVLFAAHGFFIMLLTFWQYCLYSKDGDAISGTCKSFVMGLAAISLGYWQLLHAGSTIDDPLASLHFLYFLGNVKLVLTFLSYLPQAILNAQRKSTEGFSIGQVLLDVTGGSLSMMQVLLHCGFTGNWSDISSSPAKFLLGWCSILFDLLFLSQHYILYSGKQPLYSDKQPKQMQLQLVRTTPPSKIKQ